MDFIANQGELFYTWCITCSTTCNIQSRSQRGHETLTLNATTGTMELVTHGREFFLSYDNQDTFNIKYRFAYDNCMGGIMWYVKSSLNVCANTPNSIDTLLLLRWSVDQIFEPIELYEMHPSTMPSVSILPTTKTGSPSSTPTYEPTLSPTILPPCGFHCPPEASAFLPLTDCVGFYLCENGEMSHRTLCNNGLVFDEINQVCNWDWAVQECSCVSELGQSSNSIPVYPPVSLPSDQCDGEMRMSVNMGYYESWAKNRFEGCNPIQPGEIDVDTFGYTRELYCLLSGEIIGSNSEVVLCLPLLQRPCVCIRGHIVGREPGAIQR